MPYDPLPEANVPFMRLEIKGFNVGMEAAIITR